MAAMTKRENYLYVIQCNAGGKLPARRQRNSKKKVVLTRKRSPKVSFIHLTDEKSLRRFLRQVCHHVQANFFPWKKVKNRGWESKQVVFNLKKQITWANYEDENEVTNLSRTKLVLLFVLVLVSKVLNCFPVFYISLLLYLPCRLKHLWQSGLPSRHSSVSTHLCGRLTSLWYPW